MPPLRQGAVPREIVAVGALFALEAAVVFATYSRLPLRDLYHVSGTGPSGGLSRVVVYLNWPTALVALAVLPFIARDVWPLAVVAAALCFGLFWPGVVDQADLDAKWPNAIPAAGVALTAALIVWQVGRRGVAPPRRLDGDLWRIGVAALLMFVSLPWIAAELGVDLPGLGVYVTDEWWAPFGHARLEHAVHHGQHHGMVGTLCALTALALSRALPELGRRARAVVAVWLGVLLTYGLAAVLNDGWYEQLVKRGVTTIEVPSALQPGPNLPWLLILAGGGIVARLFVRDAATARPARARVPRIVLVPLAAAAVALVAVGAAQAEEPTAHTPLARAGGGTIVFPMATSGPFHLYAIGADGHGLRQLTDEDASDLAPDWSPYGLLAFQSNREDGGDVFVSDGELRAVERITADRREGEPAWAPDGDRLGLVRDGDLYVVGVRGGRGVHVAAGAHWPTWAPDGSGLAYEVQYAGHTGIVIDHDAGSIHPFGSAADRYPAWSPHGDRIAFECRVGAHWHICTATPTFRSRRVLTPGDDDEFAPAWSPDGERIAFIGDRDGNDQLYVMRADGSAVVRLTSGQADKETPSWSTD